VGKGRGRRSEHVRAQTCGRRHQRPSEAIRGHQWPSVAFSPPGRSKNPKPVRSCRPAHSAPLPVLATSSTSALHAFTSLRAKAFSAASHSSMSATGAPVGRARVVVITCMLGRAAPSASGAPRPGTTPMASLDERGHHLQSRTITGNHGQSREIAPRPGTTPMASG